MAFGFLKGDQVQVQIELDRPQGPYYPGEMLHAIVTIQNRKQLKVREVRAGLVFWERYAYETRDSEGDRTTSWATHEEWVARETLVGGGVVPAGFSQSFRLQWQIPPNAVPPCKGKITTNRWLVRVTFDQQLKRDINEEVELPLVVPPSGQWREPGEYGEASHPQEADMALWLPRLEWVEGETVEGRLVVRPQKDFTVGEVRVELVRREHVPRDRGKTEWIEQGKARLAEKASFQAGGSYEYPFAFQLPVQGCPSRVTPSSAVSWIIKGILSRRLQKDFTVEEEISVHNGRGPAMA